jgi:chloramphenicol 3-O phosphotransferase
MTPERCRPGIGLRPGEPDHPAARLVPALYATLYDSIAAHARLGPNVVVEVGHHDVAIPSDCARRIVGLDALPVGIRCAVEVILGRRADSPTGTYAVCASR